MNFSKIKIFIIFLSLFSIFFIFLNKAGEIKNEEVLHFLNDLSEDKEILKGKLGKKEKEFMRLETLRQLVGENFAEDYYEGLKEEIQGLKGLIKEGKKKIGRIKKLRTMLNVSRKSLGTYKTEQADLEYLQNWGHSGVLLSNKLSVVKDKIKIAENEIKICEKKLEFEGLGRKIEVKELPQQLVLVSLLLEYQKKISEIFKGLTSEEKEKLNEIYRDEDLLREKISQGKHMINFIRLQAVGNAIHDVVFLGNVAQPHFSGKYFQGKRYIFSGHLTREKQDALSLPCYVKAKTGEKEWIAKKMVQHYKIHLMPIEEDIIKITRKLLNSIVGDTELQQLIYSFKVLTYPEEVLQWHNLPRIVIYAAAGKENAQRLLDKIYELFKDDKGSGRTPGCNGKVTDLIYFAQGDRDDKEKEEFSQYYEKPDKVYYKRGFAGIKEDFYLENPAKK